MTKDLDSKLYVMCENMAKGYRNGKMYDDLLQEGLLGCYDTLAQYDSASYGDEPEKYFWFIAKRAMSEYYQRGSRLVPRPRVATKAKGGTPSQTEDTSTRDPCVGFDDTNDIPELSCIDSQRVDFEDKEYLEWITSKFYNSLSERETQIILLRFFSSTSEVLSYDKVGQRLSPQISGTRVRELERDILSNIRGLSMGGTQ